MDSGNYSTALTAFFAFDSDLSEKGLTELKRYTKYDPDWQEDPVIKVICIVGSGYWYFDYDTKKWEYHPATQNYDEVIDLVGNMVNTLTHSLFTVREAWLGDYVMMSRNAYTYDPSKG